ncbi:MAG TPA: YciI family protein [Solirubrobacterales bacterium]|nr:YciI family protein [Solirubrobacterales bacterium]
MRFMMFMYPQISEEDWKPSADDMEAMSRYNIELREAGMLLALDGLRPPSDGASVVFEGREARVVDGPFAEAKEVVGGYWIIQADSTEEVLEWAQRCPGVDCRVEVRPIWEPDDLPQEIQEVYDRRLHIGVEDPSASAPEAG